MPKRSVASNAKVQRDSFIGTNGIIQDAISVVLINIVISCMDARHREARGSDKVSDRILA